MPTLGELGPDAIGSAPPGGEAEPVSRKPRRAFAPVRSPARGAESSASSAALRQQDDMGRLIAVSNRCGPVRGPAQAGGLAVALLDALRDRQGLWFGWSGQYCEPGEISAHTQQHGRLTLTTIDIPRSAFDGYYNYANRCLWPLFHFRLDLVNHRRQDLQAYLHVNQLFAENLIPRLKPDDLVWIHDYHLFTLADELRARGSRHRLGFFLHIPFPPYDLLNTLPHQERLMRALFRYDLIGFQTDADLQRFFDFVRRGANGTVRGTRCRAYGRTLKASVFPAGIDAQQFHKLAFSGHATAEYERMRATLGNCTQIIGVDRLDYTKGLLRRLQAIELLVEHYPHTRGKFRYLQIAPISRGDFKSYRDFRRELEQTAVSINARFGRVDWLPIHYLNRALQRQTLAGQYRASRVALVIPMRDGMNLVAKEYVAAQDADDPGVLILSQFAGAAHQMRAALQVNPYDTEAVAAACNQALEMSRSERRERHAYLMEGIVTENAAHWAKRFVSSLAAIDLPAERDGDPANGRGGDSE